MLLLFIPLSILCLFFMFLRTKECVQIIRTRFRNGQPKLNPDERVTLAQTFVVDFFVIEFLISMFYIWTHN